MQLPYIGLVDTTLHNMATLIYVISIKTCYLLGKQVLTSDLRKNHFHLVVV